MNKPDVIQMHLDILYKSISYLSRDKIEAVLPDYKLMKEKKRKEEEEKLLIRSHLKKSRGRSNSKRRSDQEMADLSTAKTQSTQLELNNGQYNSLTVSTKECHQTGVSLKNSSELPVD